MAESDASKLIADAESALHRASEVVEDTLASTKTSISKADKKLTQEAGALQKGLESVLGGKSLFWVEEPVDGRRLGQNMAGWGAFGVAVHAWHRGVQRMPVLGRPYRPYMLAFPIWSLLGYYIHHFELRQEEVVARRRLLLKRNRGLLEEKDYQEMALSQGFKERHEKKSKLLGWFSSSSEEPTVPKTYRIERPEAPQHPMKAKVQDLVAKGHGEMEGYGKKLHEKLDAFEKEFEAQDPAKPSRYANASAQPISPYLSSQSPSSSSAGRAFPGGRAVAPELNGPSAATTKAMNELYGSSAGNAKREVHPEPIAQNPRGSSGGGSSWGSFLGFGGKDKGKDDGDVVAEVEKALR